MATNRASRRRPCNSSGSPARPISTMAFKPGGRTASRSDEHDRHPGRRRRPARGDSQDLHRGLDRTTAGVHLPTGRAWARELGYPEPELSRVPDATVESFAGVANHWTLGRVEPGAVVLDLGCGAGTDLLIAAQMTGASGRVIGVDMTAAMLDRARESAVAMGLDN